MSKNEPPSLLIELHTKQRGTGLIEYYYFNLELSHQGLDRLYNHLCKSVIPATVKTQAMLVAIESLRDLSDSQHLSDKDNQ